MSAGLGVAVMWNPLTFLFLVLLVVLGGGVALFLWLDGRKPGSPTKQQQRWKQVQQARDEAMCRAIEEGLQEWLMMLGLPQLEEKTKLEAATRQPRFVSVADSASPAPRFSQASVAHLAAGRSLGHLEVELR